MAIDRSLCKYGREDKSRFQFICLYYEDLRKIYLPDNFWKYVILNALESVWGTNNERLLQELSHFSVYAHERKLVVMNCHGPCVFVFM